jgi:uncharacterized protein involved in exopolysaccharide biosynthesis
MRVSERSWPEVETDAIDVGALIRSLWSDRWLIVALTTLFAVSGIAYALLAREWFQADVVLIQSDSRAMSSTLNQLGSLASLAGINIGGPGGKSPAPLAVLRSREFAREFIQDEKLLQVVLFDKWDSKKGRWKDMNPKRQPDIRDAVATFDKSIRAVYEDKRTGLVTLSVTWTNPDEAAAWANLLVKRLNARLRSQAIAESEENIGYLQKEMASTTITPLQQSIGKVLESEMEKLMLARGQEQFAFKVIDSAVSPKKRIRPKRVLVVAASALCGLLCSAVFVLIRSSGFLRVVRSEAANPG